MINPTLVCFGSFYRIITIATATTTTTTMIYTFHTTALIHGLSTMIKSNIYDIPHLYNSEWYGVVQWETRVVKRMTYSINFDLWNLFFLWFSLHFLDFFLYLVYIWEWIVALSTKSLDMHWYTVDLCNTEIEATLTEWRRRKINSIQNAVIIWLRQ